MLIQWPNRPFRSSVNHSYLSQTSTSTAYPWEGTASYFTLNTDGI